MRRYFAAGNWKMNGLHQDLTQLDAIAEAGRLAQGVEVVIFPPATLLARAARDGIALGGQNCHAAEKGAYTGDLSAQSLADAGARYVIVGHSERRTAYGESSAQVAAKVQTAWAAGLTAILCIGENASHYHAGTALEWLGAQLRDSIPQGAHAGNTVIAYEPIWAVGTGLTPTIAEIAFTCEFIRAALPDQQMSLLYGGSVVAKNASDIFAIAGVDGGLIGGASLKAQTFIPIINALKEAKKHDI